MLVPSTGYIVDDVLPTFHDKYNDDEDISKISSTLSRIKSDLSICVNALRANTKTAVSFTTKPTTIGQQKGAYTGYQELCKALGITPIDDSTLKKDSYPRLLRYNIFFKRFLAHSAR